jgi:hypothetical protein
MGKKIRERSTQMPLMTNATLRAVFVVFAFAVQVLLVLNFTARNWRPKLELKYGWVIYALALVALLLALVFALGRQPGYAILAPLTYALWAGFGYYVDAYRHIEWRNPPRLTVLIPYVLLFIASQFAFWIPLWYVGLGHWAAYGVFYVVNTALNLYSHRRR